MTILIVEDETDIRFILTEFLTDEGYAVAGVANGLEALDYLRQHDERPRLILLDLGMPVMSGWAFRDEQQRDPALTDIPVIVVSATTHLDQIAATLHVNDYLHKPVDITKLLDKVGRYCA